MEEWRKMEEEWRKMKEEWRKMEEECSRMLPRRGAKRPLLRQIFYDYILFPNGWCFDLCHCGYLKKMKL